VGRSRVEGDWEEGMTGERGRGGNGYVSADGWRGGEGEREGEEGEGEEGEAEGRDGEGLRMSR
jgi:hypothetical protein